MHDLRSAILSGEPARPATPIASKRRKAAPDNTRSLTAIAVKREESRLTNHRREERHRNIFDQAMLIFRRRKYEVSVVNVSSGGIMIEAAVEVRIGQNVEIQFPGCNRTKCVVRWLREDRLGLEFLDETTIIGSMPIQEFIIRRLNGEPDVEPVESTSKSRAPRHGFIWKGTIHCNHDSVPVRLRNISADGAMVEADHEFPLEQEVLLDLDQGGTAFARVCWTRGGQTGLKFDQKFDLKRLANVKPTPVSCSSTNVLKPAYLESEGKADSPWAAMWDRLTLRDLK